MSGKHIKIGLIWGLGVGAFASTAVVAAALMAPQSSFAGTFRLAQIHEARAAWFAASGTPDDLEQARAETLLTLRQAPANSTAWLRLAYIDSVSPQGLGEQANLALARSYAVAPYGPDDTTWRLVFAFNHWPALTVSNRQLAIEELSYLAARRSPKVAEVRTGVADPAGRLALRLVLDAAATRLEAQTRQF